MMTIDIHPKDKRVDVQASGRLTREDYDRFVPELEQVLSQEEPVDFYVELHRFKGWEGDAIRGGAEFDAARRRPLGRVAVVGNGSLAAWATAMSKLFFPAEVRYFSQAGADEARAWLRSPAKPLPI
jgi:hypothetical protein